MVSASATVTVAARTASVRPDLACMVLTTSFMAASCLSSAWITTSTPSPSTLRSGSVTSAATSINASWRRSRPVISQSIQTRRSFTSYSLMIGTTKLRERWSGQVGFEGQVVWAVGGDVDRAGAADAGQFAAAAVGDGRAVGEDEPARPAVRADRLHHL